LELEEKQRDAASAEPMVGEHLSSHKQEHVFPAGLTIGPRAVGFLKWESQVTTVNPDGMR
jgi:hypothetical protein